MSFQNDYRATIKKVACNLNEDYFVNNSCSVKPVKRYVSMLNIEADLVKKMTDVIVNNKFKI